MTFPSAYASAAPQSLFDRITDPATLLAGWAQVRRNKGGEGGDGVTWQQFEAKLAVHLDRLHRDLADGRYRPGRLRRVPVKKPDGRRRWLSIPPIRDRVAQTAAAFVLTPLFDELMSDASFAYRPGRSVQMAVHQARDLMAHGHVWVVDVDIKRFFDTIPHSRLLAELAIWVNDERFLMLAARWLRSFCFWRSLLWRGRGVAQGAPISPLFANLYLHPVDRVLAAAGVNALRYADDILVLCRSQQEAENAKAFLESLILGRGLSINRAKSRILHASQGFVFLGEPMGGEGFAASPVLDLSEKMEAPIHAEAVEPGQLQLDRAEPAGARLALEDRVGTIAPF